MNILNEPNINNLPQFFEWIFLYTKFCLESNKSFELLAKKALMKTPHN